MLILQRVDFKNVQRRVYDALNVLSAMDIIRKDKNQIFYNPNNEHVDNQSLRCKSNLKIASPQDNSQDESDCENVSKK